MKRPKTKSELKVFLKELERAFYEIARDFALLRKKFYTGSKSETVDTIAEKYGVVFSESSRPEQKNPKKKKCTTGMRVQSYLFDRSIWTESQAKKWLRDHDAKIPKVDKTKNYYRYRQESPTHFRKKPYGTKEIGKNTGIYIVTACPLKKWT